MTKNEAQEMEEETALDAGDDGEDLTLSAEEAGGDTGGDDAPDDDEEPAAAAQVDAPAPKRGRAPPSPERIAEKMRQAQQKRTQAANAGRRIITQRPIKLGKSRTIPANTDVTEEAQGWGNLAFMLRQGTVIAVDGSGVVAAAAQQNRAKVLAAQEKAPAAAPAAPGKPAAPPAGKPAEKPATPVLDAKSMDALRALTPQDTAEHVRAVVSAAGFVIPEGATKAKMLTLVRDHLQAPAKAAHA